MTDRRDDQFAGSLNRAVYAAPLPRSDGHDCMVTFTGIPGSDLIEAGLDDLQHGRQTVASLLVAIGAPRLRRIGLELPKDLPASPEHRLYKILSEDDSDSAHSRYNALIRKLVSFERAAECVKV
ncbi:MAG TPA: hypothetical protein VNG71_02365 [Pyrinomonadaceae bacterium]|nr:hypothetical protein [Pyrinomonadaceae bacterium]